MLGETGLTVSPLSIVKERPNCGKYSLCIDVAPLRRRKRIKEKERKGNLGNHPFRLIRKDRAEIQNLRLYTPLRIARLEGEDTEGAFSVRGMDFRLFENGSTDRSSFQPSSLRKNSDIMATGMNGSTILVSSNFLFAYVV